MLQHELHGGPGGGQQLESLVVGNITEDLVIDLYYGVTDEDVSEYSLKIHEDKLDGRSFLFESSC